MTEPGRTADRGVCLHGTARAIAAAMLTLLLVAGAAAGPAHAAAATIDLAQTIELVKREVAAAVRMAPADGPPLHIDEAQLDLALVEAGDARDVRLAVPAADFGVARESNKDGGKEPGRQGAQRPALRRAVSLDLLVPRPPAQPDAAGAAAATVTDPARGAAAPSPDAPAPASAPTSAQALGGPLARAIADIVRAARQGAAAEPAFETKRVSLDLDFAVQRDGRGAVLLIYAADRRIEPRNVHKLRLKLSTRSRSRGGEPAPERAGDRAAERAGERTAEATADR